MGEHRLCTAGVMGSNPIISTTPPTVSLTAIRDAHVAQPVEHVLGKNGVMGSSPIVGSTLSWCL